MSHKQADEQHPQIGTPITSTCPSCGTSAARTVYDIGSGPEVACANCEWCWSPIGRDLKPLDVEAILAEARQHLHDTP